MAETFGAWELESLVAVGGLGEVWRARRGENVEWRLVEMGRRRLSVGRHGV